jgi:hypothetical protein
VIDHPIHHGKIAAVFFHRQFAALAARDSPHRQ